MADKELNNREKLCQILQQVDIEPKTKCQHQYRELFPTMAQELITAIESGTRDQFSEKYSAIFDEVYSCDPCVDEYLSLVSELENS